MFSKARLRNHLDSTASMVSYLSGGLFIEIAKYKDKRRGLAPNSWVFPKKWLQPNFEAMAFS